MDRHEAAGAIDARSPYRLRYRFDLPGVASDTASIPMKSPPSSVRPRAGAHNWLITPVEVERVGMANTAPPRTRRLRDLGCEVAVKQAA